VQLQKEVRRVRGRAVSGSAGGGGVTETDEDRASGDQGREVGKMGAQVASEPTQASPPPAGPLTTTWLQRTTDSFSHTASKPSSSPKLHSSAAP
jgi:type IV secretory pathway TrbL component